MTVPNIIKVAVPVPIHRLFDYQLPNLDETVSIVEGMRVQVPFGSRQLVGFAIRLERHTTVPSKQLKSIIKILDTSPLWKPSLLALLKWASEYYHQPLGEVMAAALPARLRSTRCVKSRKHNSKNRLLNVSDQPNPILNREQSSALQAVEGCFNEFRVFLLQGVTGSGKTEVYLRLIQRALDLNKQVLLLVPEISLTPQMMARLHERLGERTVLYHSGLTDAQRVRSFDMIREGHQAVVVGTRSAVFMAFRALGLIIVDEEHDASFKQDHGFAYHARDVAIMRARLENIPVLLGSATPSIESLWNAQNKKYGFLKLTHRATGAASPEIELIDMRQQSLIAGLSLQLIDQIKAHLARNNQVMLFLNRRGFAPIYLCHGCGWVATCDRCERPFRLHHRPRCLRCHLCETVQRVFDRCQNCQQAQLFELGQGTQRLEEELAHHFPGVECIRIDADSTRNKGQLLDLLSRVSHEKPIILIGTQIIAKGHHFPRLTLAAIIDGDAGLFNTDFRALEKTSQLLVQVIGRVGRSTQAGHVMIQTYHPSHWVFHQLRTNSYEALSASIVEERQQTGWPPFSYLGLLRVQTRTQSQGIQFLEQLKNQLPIPSEAHVLGPVPALIAKTAGYYRSQLLFQAPQRRVLSMLLKQVRIYLDQKHTPLMRYELIVDPLDIA